MSVEMDAENRVLGQESNFLEWKRKSNVDRSVGRPSCMYDVVVKAVSGALSWVYSFSSSLLFALEPKRQRPNKVCANFQCEPPIRLTIIRSEHTNCACEWLSVDSRSRPAEGLVILPVDYAYTNLTMADLEAVLADVSYLMAMEKSKCTPAARASKKIVLPDPRSVSIEEELNRLQG